MMTVQVIRWSESGVFLYKGYIDHKVSRRGWFEIIEDNYDRLLFQKVVWGNLHRNQRPVGDPC